MAKTAKNIFDEKVSLIYEYNKKSPLFVREANTEIFANNLDTAIEILQQGLLHFPNYPTAHIILAKALTLLGKYDEAIAAYRKGCGLINSEASYKFFLEEVVSSQKLRSAFNKIPRQPLTFETDFEDEKISTFEDETDAEPKHNSFEDNLDELAEKISGIKIPPLEFEKRETEEDDNFPSEVTIASETLAKIYIAQGEITEAIEMYRRLSRNDPSKKDYFLEKISELQAKYHLE